MSHSRICTWCSEFPGGKKGTVEFGRGYREERVGSQTCGGGSLYTYHSSLSLNMPLDQGRCYCCFVADELFSALEFIV